MVFNLIYLFISSTTPRAVAGIKVSILRASFPIFVTWNPSTSFLGSTALQTFLSEICSGTGSCTRIPSIFESLFNSIILFITSSSDTVFGSFMVSLVIPVNKNNNSLMNNAANDKLTILDTVEKNYCFTVRQLMCQGEYSLPPSE